VLDGLARVVTRSGADVTSEFQRGASLALAAAQTDGVHVAVLKEGSPSCGSGYIYDGSFGGGRNAGGQGVTAALLARHGIRVYSEHELDEAAAHVRRLESA
jgi:uncharacterized protein YbbK (DUF523 family)